MPTGNFGDVYAGYLSKKIGLPIDKLIVATNQNDILHRAISSGKYIANQVEQTISPSMDIQVASNFERLIYDVLNQNSNKTKDAMNKFKKEKKYTIDNESIARIKNNFLSESLNQKETLEVIKKNYEKHGVILDPHTAVGLGAVNKLGFDKDCVILSTAHPCKFPEAINQAIQKNENLPEELNYILGEKENFDIIENNLEAIKNYINQKLNEN